MSLYKDSFLLPYNTTTRQQHHLIYLYSFASTKLLLISIISFCTMKSIPCLLAMLVTVQAAPVTDSIVLSERQLGGADTRNDLQDGNAAQCPKAIFIFARASGEDGNMVCSTSDLGQYTDADM